MTQNNETAHTPWILHSYEDGDGGTVYAALESPPKRGWALDSAVDSYCKQTIEKIIKRVNSHDALVEALKDIRNHEKAAYERYRDEFIIELAEAALKQAGVL